MEIRELFLTGSRRQLLLSKITKDVWQDEVLGKDGEVVLCLLILLPMIPFMLYWGVILIKKSLLDGSLVESILFGMVFVGADFISIMFILLLMRLKDVIQKISVIDNRLIGSAFFNKKFSFGFDDIEYVQTLYATRFKNSIGSLADMMFTIRFKDGARLSVLNSMENSDGLFNLFKAKKIQIKDYMQVQSPG